jgi:ABC-type glycerol-3-phosphate transport system permease component
MALIIPLFLQFTKLKLVDSYFGIILIYTAFHLAYSIYLIVTYFKNISEEILEAATIDGCSRIQLLTSILLPLSKSGLIVLSVINFSLVWNDVLFGFIFLQKPEIQTVMVAIAKFQGKYGVGNMTHILAALFLITIPTVLLYLLAQRFFREGVLAGSIK